MTKHELGVYILSWRSNVIGATYERFKKLGLNQEELPDIWATAEEQVLEEKLTDKIKIRSRLYYHAYRQAYKILAQVASFNRYKAKMPYRPPATDLHLFDRKYRNNLTERQRLIYDLRTSGKLYREIAAELQISLTNALASLNWIRRRYAKWAEHQSRWRSYYLKLLKNPVYKRIMRLRYEHGYSNAKIAMTTGMTRLQVASKIHLAIQSLRNQGKMQRQRRRLP
jgi:DNA-directed RNA polymerase specialized sigma24 family protein